VATPWLCILASSLGPGGVSRLQGDERSCTRLLRPTEVVEYSCNLAPDLMGEFVENVAKGMDTYSMRQPLGVRFRCHVHAKLHPTLCLVVSRASAATRKSWKEIKRNHHDSNVHALRVGGCGHLSL